MCMYMYIYLLLHRLVDSNLFLFVCCLIPIYHEYKESLTLIITA